VTKPHQLAFAVSKPRRSSFAFRFIFFSASRSICSFICEYFLNTVSVRAAGDANNTQRKFLKQRTALEIGRFHSCDLLRLSCN